MDIFILRQAVLTALFQCQNPVSLNSLQFHQEVCGAFGKLVLSGSDLMLIRRELGELTQAGYVENVAGFPDWYKLASHIRLSMAQSGPDRHDPFLFGPVALR